jgi:hypothetical protein
MSTVENFAKFLIDFLKGNRSKHAHFINYNQRNLLNLLNNFNGNLSFLISGHPKELQHFLLWHRSSISHHVIMILQSI